MSLTDIYTTNPQCQASSNFVELRLKGSKNIIIPEVYRNEYGKIRMLEEKPNDCLIIKN